MDFDTPRMQGGRTALVLAGGGVPGALFEVGALQALNHFLLGRTVNDFDIYVGTSAGAIVSALLANDVSPETMLEVIAGTHPRVRSLQPQDVLAWSPGELCRWGLNLPWELVRAMRANKGGLHWPSLVLSLAESLPPGLCDSRGIERFLRQALADLGGTNRFEELPHELHLIATELQSGERAVFTGGQARGATISQAVAASTALPVVYKPVPIDGRLYVDGGLRGHASLDVAIERGADLVICINALVPGAASAAQAGASQPVGQAWRLMRINAHAALQYHLKHLRQRYPEVDLLLIEPRSDDAGLLSAGMLQYPPQRDLASHSFQTVTQQLTENQTELAQVLARHGLATRPLAAGTVQPLAAESQGRANGRLPRPGRLDHRSTVP